MRAHSAEAAHRGAGAEGPRCSGLTRGDAEESGAAVQPLFCAEQRSQQRWQWRPSGRCAAVWALCGQKVCCNSLLICPSFAELELCLLASILVYWKSVCRHKYV